MSKKTATLAQLLESARRSEALTMQVAQAAQTALSGKASNPNLLDNWYFAGPINQRGQTEYTGGGYMIDRWKTEGTNTTILESQGLKFTSTVNDYSAIKQIVENPKQYIGKTLTFSVLGKAISGSPGLFVPYHGVTALSSILSVVSHTFVFGTVNGENIDDLQVNIWSNGSPSSFEVVAAKLELGSQQTLARQDADGNWVLNDPPPNKALELAKCQRYQVVYHNTECAGIANGNTILIPKPCMRANPTVLQNGATLDIASYTVGLNELTLQSVAANNAFIVAKVQNMNFDCTPVFVKWDSPAYLILDANL